MGGGCVVGGAPPLRPRRTARQAHGSNSSRRMGPLRAGCATAHRLADLGGSHGGGEQGLGRGEVREACGAASHTRCSRRSSLGPSPPAQPPLIRRGARGGAPCGRFLELGARRRAHHVEGSDGWKRGRYRWNEWIKRRESRGERIRAERRATRSDVRVLAFPNKITRKHLFHFFDVNHIFS
jgi:hypothetical protein